MQVSGGHLLPPVQKLVATFIFAESENANRFRGAMGAPPVAEPSDLSEWLRPRACALPVADEAQAQCVQRSTKSRKLRKPEDFVGYRKRAADDEAGLSARKLPGTATGQRLIGTFSPEIATGAKAPSQ